MPYIPSKYFTVAIKEPPDENFGIGGRSTDKIKAAYAQAHPADHTEKGS